MRVKLGFVGIGAMGLSHLKAFQERFPAESEIVAVCSSSPARIAQALSIEPQARVFSEARDLIQSDLDAVVVSAPNFLHCPLALEVLAAGRHLYLEKPAGITRAECSSLLDAASRTDRVALLGHQLRYSRYFQHIHHLVHSGEIGRPRMVWTREWRGPFQKKSRDWIQDKTRSGGALVDKNCHHFDLMNSWAGSRPQRVSAFGGRAADSIPGISTPGLDHATVSFEYENGVLGTLQLCLFARDFPGEDLEMGVIGDEGMLQTRLSSMEILQWYRGSAGSAPSVVHKPDCQSGAGWGGHLGFHEIHEAFLRAIRENHPPLTTISASVDGTLLAIAAEESAEGSNHSLVRF
jgi:predicted dehydrogenase